MKVLLQILVGMQHYSLLSQPKEKEVVAKDPGKHASLMQEEEEISLRPGTFMQFMHRFARFYKSGVIPTESSGI